MADYLIQKETAEVLANQIRRITGTENQYNIAEVAEILSRIEGNVVEAAGDLRMLVVDYDGTVLKEANLSEGQAFALPDPPSHEGLKFTEWVSCIPVKNNMIVANQANILVCPMYETTSGATEIYVTVSDITNSVFIGRLYGSEVTIDWGDDNTETLSNNNSYAKSHTYSAAGNYVIKITGAYGIGGDYSEDRSEITKIHLSNEVTSLYSYAFKNCKNMKSLTMTKNIKKINSDMIYNCHSLIQFIAPLNCEINEHIFTHSSNDVLKYAVLPYGLTNNKFINLSMSKLEMLTLPETITTLDTAFINWNDSLDDYAHITYEENGLHYISSHTNKKFAFCRADESLTEADVSDATILSAGAFEDCTLVTNVTLPTTLSKIPNRFFINCEALSSISLPDTVLELGEYAFYGCKSLQSIDLKNIEKIGEYAFQRSGITSLTIPVTTADIADSAFSGCESLTSITINSNPVIGDTEEEANEHYGWFYGCTSLSDITLSESMKAIGRYMFEGCAAITNLDFISNITTIWAGAFRNCTGLTSIHIPASVSNIRNKDLNGSNPFSGCSNVETITVDSANTNYYSEGDCLINTATKDLISGCKNSIIPEGVISIGPYAFSGMGKTSITLPSTVTTLDDYAFANSPDLVECVLSPNITNWDSSVFYNCTSLQSIEIPSGITSIGTRAFDGCTGLKSITIPKSITYIGYYAFDGCTGLTSAVYEGTEEEWANVNVISGNTALTNIITFAG